MEYNKIKKEVKTSTSQSCVTRINQTSHWKDPLPTIKWAATNEFLSQAMSYKPGKASLRGISPHHTSFQNLFLDPLPKINLVWLLNKLHPFLMFFHSPTPWDPWGYKEHQLAHEEPYFASTSNLHRASLWCAKRHNHFPNKDWLKILKFLMPKPPSKIGEQTVDQLTRWYLNSSPRPPHKKSQCNFSIQLTRLDGIGNKERKYVGRLDKVLFIRVTLPPLDRCIHFQLASHLVGFLKFFMWAIGVFLYCRESIVSWVFLYYGGLLLYLGWLMGFTIVFWVSCGFWVLWVCSSFGFSWVSMWVSWVASVYTSCVLGAPYAFLIKFSYLSKKKYSKKFQLTWS
jgi:hypothetical protein